MPQYTYLRAAPEAGHVIVDAEARDWQDFDFEAHFRYHLSVFESITAEEVTIYIDASSVPYWAALHAPLFHRLARHARDNFKNRIQSIVVSNASTGARALHSALDRCGLLAEATGRKIHFVSP